jgi:hypothetical protein
MRELEDSFKGLKCEFEEKAERAWAPLRGKAREEWEWHSGEDEEAVVVDQRYAQKLGGRAEWAVPKPVYSQGLVYLAYHTHEEFGSSGCASIV